MPDALTLTRHGTAAVLAAAALLLAAGCTDPSARSSAAPAGPSTAGGTMPRSSSGVNPPARPAPASGYHSTAAALAGHIPGCDPQTLIPRTATQRLHLASSGDVTSAATCTLRGRTAIVLTFPDHAAQAAIQTQLRSRVAYYATGTGWTAAPTDTSEAVGQQSIVQDVALALSGLVEAGGS